MIVAITSSLASFKPLSFKRGLNVLLADSAPDASTRHTRNSAGKTSFVEILHFLLGSRCDAESLLRTPALIAERFSGTFIVDGSEITVERTGSNPSRIFLLSGSENRQDLVIKTDKESGRLYTPNTKWREYLGRTMFDLPPDVADEEGGCPSFRSMISYFARRRNSGGFIRPERSSEMQQRGDWQVCLSFLLGLDWRIPAAFDDVRDRERTLRELKKAAKGGALGAVVGTVAELRPELTVARDKAERRRQQLARFEVLDSYRDLTARAAEIKNEMVRLGREMVGLRETLTYLRDALAAEEPGGDARLEQLYEAAGIELPGVILKRIDEVRLFQKSIVANRKAHLEAEISTVQSSLAECDLRLEHLSASRSETLKALEGRGALEDFLALQRELAELEAAAAALQERFKAAEILEGESTKLDIDRSNLKLRLQADHQERQWLLDEAILIVAEAIFALYENRAGGFVVEATENGPEFRISIEGDRGGGISNMEIFCLDLALFVLASRRLGGPGFLVHDSHLFDGVDERQVAHALMLGQRAARASGGQYIATMNSDIFDRLPFPKGLEVAEVVMPTRLSDETDTGGLFGFRFE